MLHYHHCINLEKVIFGEIKADPKHSDFHYKSAYSWLEKEVGFYPLFLAAGTTDEDIRMTGYEQQWRVIIGSKVVGRKKDGRPIHKNILRKKGEFPNYVLFSFEDVDVVFMDYDAWYLVLCSSYNNYQMTDYEKRLIFKPSWPKSKWLRKAKKEPHSVQSVTPALYLPNAKRIWVRNQQTKKSLESMGFENVEAKRILLKEPECNCT